MTAVLSAPSRTAEAARALRASPLMRQGGFGVYQGLPDPASVVQLYNESLAVYPSANVQECWQEDREEVRGGMPKRSLLSAEAGPWQDALYSAPWLLDFLTRLCGVPVTGSGNRGTYSFYARPGDFLDVHRDVELCDVAMLTCLHDNSEPADQSGALVVYPGRIDEPLTRLRARPWDGGQAVKLSPGHTIIILGGMVPHRVLPVRSGQIRIMSVLCFRAEPWGVPR